jgi:hypothetical protein
VSLPGVRRQKKDCTFTPYEAEKRQEFRGCLVARELRGGFVARECLGDFVVFELSYIIM